jgi:AcrR family transcriptional regulator
MVHRTRLDHDAVIRAAVRLVDEEGVEALSLGRVAERLGIKTPSLYNHVTGLSGLKHDLAMFCMRDLLDHFTRVTIGRAGADAILAFADAYRAYAKAAPGRYALIQQAPDPGDTDLQALSGHLVEVVQAVLAPFGLSYQDSIHAIRSLRAIIHGFVSLELAGGFEMPVDVDASFHWCLDLYIAGLRRVDAQPATR